MNKFVSKPMTMRNTFKLILFGCLFFSFQSVIAQEKEHVYTMEEYGRLKEAGQLPEGKHVISFPAPTAKDQSKAKKDLENAKGDPLELRGSAICGCYVDPDGTYTLAMGPNDDGSTAVINLPFTFCLYGDNYTSLYINNNGNVSFGTPYATFSSNPFPDPGFVMVAPFWGDVDTRGGLGQVWYKIYPNAIYVNWDNVGYYSQHGDKRNTFQLILTDGTDPFVGVGNNVAFCYKEMEWTTGDASSGTNGFGGVPSTVGSNRGNGTDFVQFGRFDQPGGAYDGPFGNPDGIDWLDFATFKFNTCVTGSNIAPVVAGVQPSTSSGTGSGIACGDTLNICGVNDTLVMSVSFIAPENGQTISITANAPTLNNFTVLSTANGTIDMMVISDIASAGFHIIDVTATDNGTPPMSTTFPLTVFIDTSGLSNFNPVITGPLDICQGNTGTLDVGAGYDFYSWNTGATTQTINADTSGTYFVTVGQNGCFASAFYDVEVHPNPTPLILGAQSGCGTSTTLYVDSTYSSYFWSDGSTDSTVVTSSGTYTVTVTDQYGCTGTSPSVNVALNPYPVADYNVIPPTGTAFLNDTIQFIDSSFVSAGSIAAWLWVFGDGDSSTVQNPIHIYDQPGQYQVTLYVTTAAGCLDSITFVYEVIPQNIIIPNVFSPGTSSGSNDLFVVQNLQYFPNSKLQVYNRWGKMVYESMDYKNDWNGEHYKNGKLVPAGTYFYILTMEDGKTYNGSVTVFSER